MWQKMVYDSYQYDLTLNDVHCSCFEGEIRKIIVLIYRKIVSLPLQQLHDPL